MACNERLVPAGVATVWAVLTNGGLFPEWVVGTRKVVAVDGAWPAPHARLPHRVGLGPFNVEDVTEVLECANHRLVPRARARPLGAALVVLEREPRPDGTMVRLCEAVESPERLKRANAVLSPLVRARNARSLWRLERVVRREAGGCPA